MKVLLVTSRITYVKDNYDLLFRELMRQCPEYISGLALIENLDRGIIKSTAGLFVLGAWRTGLCLLVNILASFCDKRQRRFRRAGIRVLRVRSMNDKGIIRWVRDNGIDLIVNMRTRCIYGRDILEAPALGCINIHHGILPVYRGTMCDLYALYERREAGFTIHRMNERIDNGEIYLTGTVSKNCNNYPEHIAKSSVIEGKELARLIKEMAINRKFPEARPNSGESIVFTKNPSGERIREMIKSGMRL